MSSITLMIWGIIHVLTSLNMFLSKHHWCDRLKHFSWPPNFTEMSGKCGVLASWQCSNKTTMHHLESYWLGTYCCSKAMNQIQAHNLGLFCPGAAIRLFKYGFQEAFVRSWGWYSHSWMGITNCVSPWKQREIRKKPH